MPELPEVEALAGVLTERAVGRRIDRVDVAAFSVLKTYDPALSEAFGRPISAVVRRGKFLDMRLGSAPTNGSGTAQRADLHLVFHLARAGWLQWKDALSAAPPRPGKGPLALRLHLDDGSGFDLTEAGTQKRLAVYLVRDPGDVPGVARLGIDPFDPAFTAEALGAILRGSRQQIKGLLRDQSILAGIGNAYSDEVLHVARLSPYKIGGSFTAEDVLALHAAILTTLTEAVGRSRGLAAGELKAEKKLGLRVHGRAGQPCPVCGDTVREVSFADSALQYCPTCQTGGKPLADRRLSRLLK